MRKSIYKLFVGFPIHFQAYVEEDDRYILEFSNKQNYQIDELKMKLGHQVNAFNVSTNASIFYVTIKKAKTSFSIDQVYIEEVIMGKEIKKTLDYEMVLMAPPVSVFSLRPYHRIYQKLMSEKTNQKPQDIKYVAKQHFHYWHCSCGERNLDSADTCQACNALKKELFDTKIQFEENISKTKTLRLTQYVLFIWLSLTFISQILYEALVGDFLYTNFLKNQFFGVFNRMILPFLLILLLLGMTFTLIKAKKRLSIAFLSSEILIYLYLNVLSAIYFVGSAYNLMFVIAMNFGVIWLFGYFMLKKWRKIIIYGLGIISISALLVIRVNWLNFASYDLKIQENGLFLTIDTKDVHYIIPDRINQMKVIEVDFQSQNEFQMESLTLGKYVEKIHVYSAMVLDDLKHVYVDPLNLQFFVENNLLFDQNGLIQLVPVHTENLYIDNEIIVSGPFRDLINLKSLTFGPHVKLIKHEAFINAQSLTQINFDQNSIIEEIQEYAFLNAASLKSVELPISLRHLGIGIFNGANQLESLKAPFIGPEREESSYLYLSHDILVYFFGSNTYLHSHLIPTSLKKVEFYDIKMIHHTTFYNAQYLEEIILPDTMKNIGIRSFYGTHHLFSMVIPDGITHIPESAFEDSGIKSIVIPASVKFIDINAFKNTSLTEVIYLGDINALEIITTGNEGFIEVMQN